MGLTQLGIEPGLSTPQANASTNRLTAAETDVRGMIVRSRDQDMSQGMPIQAPNHPFMALVYIAYFLLIPMETVKTFHIITGYKQSQFMK